MAASLAIVLIAFWPTLLSMHGVWTRYTYSHGYLTLPIVIWLAWRRRDAVLVSDSGSNLAIIPLLFFSFVWLGAIATNTQVIHEAALVPILLLWAAIIAGWEASRRLLPAAAIFLFAVPFWNVFTRPLQLVTIKMSGLMVKALGIQADITGETIRISSGVFRVAGSCSGLNLLMVGMLLATLYAHLFANRWRTRFQIFALAVILSLVANWLRVSGLVVIGHRTAMQADIVYHHGTYGWAVFAVMFAVFFFPVAGYVARRGGREGRETREEPPEGRASEATAAHPEARVSGPLRLRAMARRVLLATGIAVLGPVVYFGIRAMPPGHQPELVTPVAHAGWRLVGDDGDPPDGWTPRFPTPDSRQVSVWTDGSAEIYRLALRYSRQDQGRELISDINSIGPPDDVALDHILWVPDNDTWVREAFVRTPEGGVVVWYWYWIGGMKTASSPRAKALSFWAFLIRRPSAALVTLSTKCDGGQCTEARNTLRRYLATVE